MKDLAGLLNQIRSKLDDVDSDELVQFCSDEELTEFCNEGLVLQARAAQVIKLPVRFSTVANKGQYAFASDPTDIFSVRYATNGIVTTLKRIDEGEANDGIILTGVPTCFYLMWYTNALQYQDGTDEIVLINVKDKRDLRCVIGLHPIPESAGDKVTINTVGAHPELIDGSSKVLIPFPFAKGTVHYAVAQALEKEKFYDEAKMHYDLMDSWTEKLKEFCSQANSTGHPQVKMVEEYDSYGFTPGDRVFLP